MRIGIDGLPLTEELTGIGYYTLELSHHLAATVPGDEVQVVSPRAYWHSLDQLAERPTNLRLVRSRVSPITRHWWSIGLPRYVRRQGIEVFHGTNFEVPLRRACATVVTIHDLSMLLYPHTQERKRVRRAQRRLPLMARAATMIITPTESVRREVHEHLGIPMDRIVAVPEAARICFQPLAPEQIAATRIRLGICHDFLLFVGTVEPRKNLTTLLRAFEEVLRLRQQPLQLVIAGRTGWLVDDLLTSLKRSPAAANIVLTGYLPDQDLGALYSACAALVYPSVYEGFGLPPLEAMACGAPVIASDIPAIREVAGAAARLVSADDSAELARAVIELVDSATARKTMSAAGLKRAAEFSWARAASASRDVYVEARARFSETN
jgi:glycosyltransferase involved in cell wall biosynthesis